MKFKVGENVRVVQCYSGGSFAVGDVVKIIQIGTDDGCNPNCYGAISPHDGYKWYLYEDEVEPIPNTAIYSVSLEQAKKVWDGCEECRNQANWPVWIKNGFVFCPKCGTPLASWAWKKHMQRLEELKDGSTTN